MGTESLQMLQSRGEVCKLQAKSKFHESKASYRRLQAAHFKTQATSHSRLCDSHWLMEQWYKVKMEAVSDSTLRLQYELKARYHLLQVEHHRERFTYYREIAIEHGKKAEAHELLFDYLQHKMAKRRIEGG